MTAIREIDAQRWLESWRDLSAEADQWDRDSLTGMAASVARVLARAFDSEFAYVRLEPVGSLREAASGAAGAIPPDQREQIATAVRDALEGPDVPALTLENPIGSGTLALAIERIGFGGSLGLVAVGKEGTSFPAPADRLFLQSACARVALALLERSAPSPPPESQLSESLEANAALVSAGLQAREAADDAIKNREQLEALVRGLADGVVVLADSGEILLLNLAARRILHLESAEIGTPWPGLEYTDLAGAPVPDDERPVTRALRGETLESAEMFVNAPGHPARRCLFYGNSLRDPQGKVVAVIVTIRDVTELRQLEKLREEYLALVSHDLRSPLSIVVGAAHRLTRTYVPNAGPEVGELVQLIAEGGQRMNRIISQVMDAAALEAGHDQLQQEPISIVPLVASIVHRVAAEGGRDIAFEAPATAELIWGDSSLIERAIGNLIDNALKYSDAPAPVSVTIKAGPREAVVSVRDAGRGIPAAAQPHIFDRLYRVREGNQNPGGYGLGLYLVRLIAEAHGGRIWVQSAPGVGSTFNIALPTNPDGE